MARSSANRVTIRPPANVHTALTSVTHTLSHIELMGGDIAEAPVWPPAKAPTVTAGADIDAPVAAEVPAMSFMPAMGVDIAETARPMHVRLSARATDAHRPRRDQRATERAATEVGTRGTIARWATVPYPTPRVNQSGFPGMSGDSSAWEGWSLPGSTSRRYPVELRAREVRMVGGDPARP